MDDGTVVRAQGGDEAAFAEIAIEVAPRLHAVAFRILRDVQLAEDAVQQALLRSWQDLPRLRDPSRFDAWSYRVLVRICYDLASRARRRPPEVQLNEAVVRYERDEYAGVLDRDLLERGFLRLSMEQRTVVVLHHYVGLSASEVADVIGVPLETVRSRLHRALASLRAGLEADARPATRQRLHTKVPA